MVSFNRQHIGQCGEEEAYQYLQAKGFRLLEKNYRCFYGEIDLIMQDQDDVVFVEVRSRKFSDYGYAKESITKSKQKKLLKTALHYLQRKKWLHSVNSRFDVIAIDQVANHKQIEWIKNAF